MRHALAFLWSLLASLPTWAWADGASSDRDRPRIHALQEVGTPYRYGGQSAEAGFDCSGLVRHVFERAWGLPVPRVTDEQRKVGRPVKLSELQPGDLVFYNTRNRPFSHVGIYVGEGRFVHAPKPGGRVRVESLQTSYWRTRFNGARRLDPPTF